MSWDVLMDKPYVKKLTDDLFTIEYLFWDGQYTLTNSFIQQFYHSLRRRDLIFYSIEDLDKWNPIPYFRSVRLWVAFNKEGKALGGFWGSSPNNLNKSAWFNCGMQNNAFEDPKDYIKIAHIGLKFMLDRPEFHTLYGETSESNLAILSLADYFGFIRVGKVKEGHWNAKENKFEDTIVTYINKDLLKKIEDA